MTKALEGVKARQRLERKSEKAAIRKMNKASWTLERAERQRRDRATHERRRRLFEAVTGLQKQDLRAGRMSVASQAGLLPKDVPGSLCVAKAWHLRVQRLVKKIGRPPFTPSEQDRMKVEFAALCGAKQKDIAIVFGVHVNTLRKHFRAELDRASRAPLVQVRDAVTSGADQ